VKFTDEELSRILSAHEGGQLRRQGGWWDEGAPFCCVVQAAKMEPRPDRAKFGLGLYSIAESFDDGYSPDWTTDQFLAWLESKGAA
jgi:hypothetical protein